MPCTRRSAGPSPCSSYAIVAPSGATVVEATGSIETQRRGDPPRAVTARFTRRRRAVRCASLPGRDHAPTRLVSSRSSWTAHRRGARARGTRRRRLQQGARPHHDVRPRRPRRPRQRHTGLDRGAGLHHQRAARVRRGRAGPVEVGRRRVQAGVRRSRHQRPRADQGQGPAERVRDRRRSLRPSRPLVHGQGARRRHHLQRRHRQRGRRRGHARGRPRARVRPRRPAPVGDRRAVGPRGGRAPRIAVLRRSTRSCRTPTSSRT